MGNGDAIRGYLQVSKDYPSVEKYVNNIHMVITDMRFINPNKYISKLITLDKAKVSLYPGCCVPL